MAALRQLYGDLEVHPPGAASAPNLSMAEQAQAARTGLPGAALPQHADSQEGGTCIGDLYYKAMPFKLGGCGAHGGTWHYNGSSWAGALGHCTMCRCPAPSHHALPPALLPLTAPRSLAPQPPPQPPPLRHALALKECYFLQACPLPSPGKD